MPAGRAEPGIHTIGDGHPQLSIGSIASGRVRLRSARPWCMMTIICMPDAMTRATSRPAASRRKDVTHERIVGAAARAIRRCGYAGTGVADVMKDVGLTHGGFYAHFASREAMLAEAADRAGAEGVAAVERVAAAAPPRKALQALLRAYLSKTHVDGVETGCAVAALGSEMPRQAPEVRRAATRRIKDMIDLVARQSPEWGQPGAHQHALATVATMVGALVLARAVDDPRLSDALREAALKHLIPTGD